MSNRGYFCNYPRPIFEFGGPRVRRLTGAPINAIKWLLKLGNGFKCVAGAYKQVPQASILNNKSMQSRKDFNGIQAKLESVARPNLDLYLSPQLRKNYLQFDAQNLNLTDLSPFIPRYNTQPSNSIYLRPAVSELAIIETPANHNLRPSYLAEIDEGLRAISGIIVWAHEEPDSEAAEENEEYESSNHEATFDNLDDEDEKIYTEGILDEQEKTTERIVKVSENTERTRKVTDCTVDIPAKTENTAKRTCNCKKTQCLKLYCDCFRENLTCDGCNCVGCHNTTDFEAERRNAMTGLIDRNPQAFRPKIESASHSKGCNCKKSGCLKKYCECYQAGLKCGENCKCEQCKNCCEPASERPPKNYRTVSKGSSPNLPSNLRGLK